MDPSPTPTAPILPGNSRQFALKSTAPQPTGHEIARTELCERIFAAGAARLVLLRAPAGFGKTTAMLQVYEHFRLTGLPVAWLTLDRADNDLARFLAALSTALGRVIPGLDTAADDSGGPDGLAFAMIDRVAAHPAPFALFIDDFEALQNPGAIGIVTELIEQLPRGAQLIIGSRGVPDLGLGRLRTRGRLLDVEPAQLRFSEAEVDAFLRQRRGLSLSTDDVRRLHRSTEGWAAALGLASIALENRDNPGRFIAGFSGSNAAVVAYLVEDVLARQTDDIRNFLLRTSVLSELNAPLCDAVCGRSDSADVLRRLEQAHLFLVPLRSDHSQYRYHGMFAEFLRAELARRNSAEIPRLHGAASRWFADSGRPIVAIEHALAGGDLAVALPALRRHAQGLLDDGRVRLLSRWLEPLRESGALDASPMLLVVHAWAVCFARGPRSAEPLLDRLEQRNDIEPEVRTHRLAMRALLLSLTDHVEEAVPLATEALASAPSDLTFVSGFIKVTLSVLALVTGRFHDALRYADAARSPERVRSSPFNLALSGAAEGAVDLTQGRLRKAIAGLRIAVGTGALDDNRPTNGNALVGIPLAQALYEAGQLEQAERLLVVYIPLIRGVCIPDELIIGHVVMARIAAEHGDDERAEQMLAELEHIGHRDGLPRVVATARLERVRMLLMADRLFQARAELDRCGDRALWSRVARLSLRANEVETYDLAVARWSVRSGHADDVIRTLRTELDAAERAQRERRALTLRILLAQALHRTDQHNKAMRMLARAVRTASAEGYVRAFLDEGVLLRALLLELRSVPDVLDVDGRGDALAFVDRLLQEPVDSAAPRSPTDATHDAAVASELLTRKELQVLRLAAEGLTNDQLAERLFVAETTVRTHLRNINVKLDTRGRVEAIAAARKLGLIG
jgi:LuxR family transcriptional regulator, maltose regulon positive regulatory protein